MRTLFLVCLLSWIAAPPARGQSAEEVQALIEQLADPDPRVRMKAAEALGDLGPGAVPAIPALIQALADEDPQVRAAGFAFRALGRIGPEAAPAVPALVEALSDDEVVTRDYAAWALHRIRADGNTLWWVLPKVYWKQLALVGLLIVGWLWFMSRTPRQRPTQTAKHLAHMAVTAAVPVVLGCALVGYLITRGWAEKLLPETLTLVPFPVAALLSTALVCTLPAVWVCQRKPLAEPDEADFP